MTINLKLFLASLMVLLSVCTQNIFCMQPLQQNLTISVRYHHPSGISLHNFSLPPGSTIGHLHTAISRKLGTDVKDQKIIVGKSYIERHPNDSTQDCLCEVKKVLLNFQRPLENDEEFGVPIVKETQFLRYILGYTTPIFDLVCLHDFAYSSCLADEYKKLLKDNIVVKKANVCNIIQNGLDSSQKYLAEKKYDNTFKEYQ